MAARRFWFGLVWVGFLIGARLPARAQTPADTAARELDAQLRRLEVSPQLRVVQVREAMVAALRRNRPSRLPGLLDYLPQQLPGVDSTACLTPDEWALLMAAAGRFADLLRQAKTSAPFYGRSCLVPYQPFPYDGLAEAARAFVAQHTDSLSRVAARRMRQPAADSAFVPLYLRVLVAGHKGVSDSLNSELRRFVQRYPASPLADVAKRYVRYEIVPSPFTVGGEFFLGGSFFQGGLGAAFTNPLRLGLGGEASWRRCMLYGRLATGSLRPRAPYTFGPAVWEPDQGLNCLQAELLAGYCVLESRWLRLTPFAGAGLLWLSPIKQNSQPLRPEADYRLWFAKPFTAGLSLEIKPSKPHERRFGPGPLADDDWSLRLRGGWRQAEARQGAPTTGGVFYVEVGMGLFVRMAGTRR